jgi:sulfate permease, SulP family
VLIILTQTRHFIGLEVPNGMPVQALAQYIATHLGEASLPTALTGLVTLATGIAVKRYLPRVPFMVVAIVAGSIAGSAFNAYGGHVATVGTLPSHLPPLSMPSFDPAVWFMLMPTALALAISALNESVSISRALAIRSRQHVDANQEFIGQGMANAIGSFFSSYVVSSSFNRSALNYAVGAQTPLSALTAGFMLAAIISVAAPLAAYLPNAAMAASLYLIGWGLIDRANIAQIARTSRTEAAIMFATLFTAIFIQVQVAILAGVVLSLVVYLYRTSNPRIVRRVPNPASGTRKMIEPAPGLPECPQFHIIRFNGSLFFGAVNAFKEELLRCGQLNPDCRHLAIIMAGVNFADIAGAEALEQMARHYKSRGGGLYLIGTNADVLAILERGHYLDAIGRENVFASKTAGFRYIYTKMDYDFCRTCGLRVFVECARKGKQEPAARDEIACR